MSREETDLFGYTNICLTRRHFSLLRSGGVRTEPEQNLSRMPHVPIQISSEATLNCRLNQLKTKWRSRSSRQSNIILHYFPAF